MKYILLTLILSGCATAPAPKVVVRHPKRVFNLESSYCPISGHWSIQHGIRHMEHTK